MNDLSLEELTAKFTLADERHRSILEATILPEFLEQATPSANPRFVLSTGQCGAGKSFAKKLIEKELGEGVVAVNFATDDLRDKHPYRKQIYDNHYRDYDALVKNDAYKWQAELIDAAIAKRANIIFEKVLTEPDDWNLEIFPKLRSAGYRVECAATGAHELQSLAGMYLRREMRIKDTGDMLPIPLEKHDKCYKNLPGILEKMEAERTVDAIAVYDRGASFWYKKDLDTRAVSTSYPDSGISAASALKICRESFKKSRSKVQDVRNDLDLAEQMMLNRNSETQKIDVVRKVRADLEAQVSPACPRAGAKNGNGRGGRP